MGYTIISSLSDTEVIEVIKNLLVILIAIIILSLSSWFLCKYGKHTRLLSTILSTIESISYRGVSVDNLKEAMGKSKENQNVSTNKFIFINQK
jgi:hypothetical protein